VIDVYRGDIQVQKNPWKLALYISFFPQLIAGPIVKYHDIAKQLESRSVSWTKMAYGIKRFTYGLGKKVIFANTFAAIVDLVLERNNRVYISTGLAWFAIVLYALQIYYDFSGYSDMAIGLGKLFGFDFMENFNYPYLSGSVREFWRRWHISLSTWFKEYVYIPLGGSRKGNMRTYVNLFVVFLVTGLWHGAGINFVLWGAYYGIFLVAERLFLGKLLEKNPWPVFNHLYRRYRQIRNCDKSVYSIRCILDRRNIRFYIINNRIQCKQERHLNQHRETSSHHRRTIFIVYLLNFLLLLHHRSLIFFISVFLLNRLNFRINDSHHF